MIINLTKNEMYFLLYSLKKVKAVYEEEGKYGSSNITEQFIKTIKEQSGIK